MSYYDDMKANRLRVNNFTLGFGSDSSVNRCSICLSQPKLILKQTEGGSKSWWCKECGTFTPQTDTDTNNSQFTSKYGSTTKPHSYIISQPKRGNKYDQKEGEIKEDIEKLTGSHSVAVRDHQEQEYDTTHQQWTYRV